MEVGPKDPTAYLLRGMEKVMMVVPIDADVYEAQYVAEETGSTELSAANVAPAGTFKSNTMIVMMTAKTPSLNASRRPLLIRSLQTHRLQKLLLKAS
jgi:hypothetical protein